MTDLNTDNFPSVRVLKKSQYVDGFRLQGERQKKIDDPDDEADVTDHDRCMDFYFTTKGGTDTALKALERCK